MNKKQSVFNWQLFLGLVLVLAGGVFLADLFLPFNLMRLFWPLLIALFGLTFIVGMLFAGRSGSGLAIPGVAHHNLRFTALRTKHLSSLGDLGVRLGAIDHSGRSGSVGDEYLS